MITCPAKERTDPDKRWQIIMGESSPQRVSDDDDDGDGRGAAVGVFDGPTTRYASVWFWNLFKSIPLYEQFRLLSTWCCSRGNVCFYSANA